MTCFNANIRTHCFTKNYYKCYVKQYYLLTKTLEFTNSPILEFIRIEYFPLDIQASQQLSDVGTPVTSGFNIQNIKRLTLFLINLARLAIYI